MYLANEDVPTSIPEAIGDQTTFLRRLWSSIDWTDVGITVIITSLQILFAVIIFLILKKLGNYFIELAFKKRLKKNNTLPNRYTTLYTLSKNIYRSVLYFFLVYTILELIGIPVGTLVAGAGVIGLALSLGAQGFVSDIVNGFMILLEKQLDIGDVVELADIMGVVEDVNLKTTKVKDFDGTIHFIPNRNITIISNKSRADMRSMIEIQLLPNTDIHLVRKLIEEVHEEWLPKYDEITVKPSNVSFVPLESGHLAVQVIMFAKAGKEFGIRNDFYEKYIDAFIKHGIELPKNYFDLSV